MAAETRYHVIRYDVLAFRADPERPGRSTTYGDMEIEPPTPQEPDFPTREAAQKQADLLMATARGEEVEAGLANGQHYKGPRYYYTVGVSGD